MKKTSYCLGFAFGELGRTKQVALIRKARPAWQAGMLNGIGGHVEQGEHPHVAMVREFKEETGCKTGFDDWDLFAKMNLPHAEVYCYRAFRIDMREVITKTDEAIYVLDLKAVRAYKCIPNLSWLVPLAMDREVAMTIINYEEGE